MLEGSLVEERVKATRAKLAMWTAARGVLTRGTNLCTLHSRDMSKLTE